MVKNMRGMKFGILTVLCRAKSDIYGNAHWVCLCECGNTVKVRGSHLRSGNTIGCGCLAMPDPIQGKTFFRLLAVGFKEVRNGRHFWEFTCECGASVIARKSHVTSGRTKSCGCLNRETVRNRSTTHGMTNSPEYISWCAMLARCEYRKHRQYKDYGGRGVAVCERWHDFQAFYDDMGKRPKGKTLDRIDNSRGYEPSNCRWATWKEQNAKGRRRQPTHRQSS